MELPIYQIDAFASRLFEGNPAAVIPLQQWLPDELLQAIAAENNVSETAYFLPDGDGFQIRWFTPVDEVDLCGHATLASAYVLFFILGYAEHKIMFFSKSGILSVRHDEDLLIMDFPAQPPVPCAIPAELMQAFATVPTACLRSMDFIAVFKHERDIEAAEPDFQQLMKLDLRGVIITAQSDRWDFVARFFAPKYGIFEDPVTGSAYTQLAPYWTSRLGMKRFQVRQMSPRGGELACELLDDRVVLCGKAIKYLEGKIHV